MPCSSAIVQSPVVLSPNESVEKALSVMKKKSCRFAPVVDEQGKIVGVFSIQALLKNLLPVSVALSDGIQFDVTVKAAPGVAKRLKNVALLSVETLMERKVIMVHPETPIWEGVSLIAQHAVPVIVAEHETGKFLGMISEQSLLDELQRMQDTEV